MQKLALVNEKNITKRRITSILLAILQKQFENKAVAHSFQRRKVKDSCAFLMSSLLPLHFYHYITRTVLF